LRFLSQIEKGLIFFNRKPEMNFWRKFWNIIRIIEIRLRFPVKVKTV